MARISHPINDSELEHTINWYFSVDNTHAANDQVLRLIDQLELPNISRRSSDRLHTSSEGQKFEVRADWLNANYLFKYFGKGQGVSVYSFIDERDLLFHSLLFSAGERESAYVIDGLMHNDVVRRLPIQLCVSFGQRIEQITKCSCPFHRSFTKI
jgi:TnpA family transposase